MLKTPVIHPTIMEVLARSGHFAQVMLVIPTVGYVCFEVICQRF